MKIALSVDTLATKVQRYCIYQEEEGAHSI